MPKTRHPSRLEELKRSELFSEELGIRLRTAGDPELFRWFLASLLFGARITQTIAKHTYFAFEGHGLITPRKIVEAGWDYLVNPVMREGGYVRYDGRKSTQILRDCEKLLADYHGSLLRLYQLAKDPRDLERRLMEFYGVGPVTVNIFLRELRPYWRKADPAPLEQVVMHARAHRIALSKLARKSLTFARVEAGLIRELREEGEIRKALSVRRSRAA